MKNRAAGFIIGAILLGFLLAYATLCRFSIRGDPVPVPDVPVREYQYGVRA